MNYYRLVDDMSVPGRWHLGGIINHYDGSMVDFRSGIRMNTPASLEAEVTQAGRALDFFLTGFATPIARKPLAKALAGIAHDDLQLLPVQIDRSWDFQVLNIRRVIRCVDEQTSKFRKWTKDDDVTPELVGQYEWIMPLKVDVTRIPPYSRIFRIEGWDIAIIVSEDTRKLMECSGCLGAKFEPVT